MLTRLRGWDDRVSGTPLVWAFLFSIVASGVFLRVYGLGEFRTEYDDVGVVTFHRAQAPVRKEFTIYSASIFDLQITKKDDRVIESLLDTPFFGPYIAFRWTYPIGQYFLYPAFIDEADGYREKLVKGRAFSTAFSCASLALFVLLLWEVNGRRWDESVLVPLALLAFSFQSVIYAKHMSPYSLSATTMILVLLGLFRVVAGRLSLFAFVSGLGVLTLFNYLILIMLPPVGVLLVLKRRPFNWRDPEIRAFYAQGLAGAFVFLLLFAPAAVLFFKPGGGFHGAMAPPFAESPAAFLWYFPRQLVLAVSSTLAGVTTWAPVNLSVAVALILAPVWAFAALWRSLGDERYLYGFAFLFVGEWVALHALHKIVLDQTRHELSWVPLYGLLTFLLWKWIRPGRVLTYALTALLIVCGLRANLRVLNERIESFDFETLEKSPIRTILTYGHALEPLGYFAHTPKRVFYIDENYFAADYDTLGLEDRLLLVSRIGLEDYRNRYPRLYERAARLYRDYDVVPVKEVRGVASTMYQTIRDPSREGFYLYELIRSGHVSP